MELFCYHDISHLRDQYISEMITFCQEGVI